jgi:beta-glucosidase
MEQRPDIKGMLDVLSLEQKLALLAGESQWRTATIPDFSIPSLKVSVYNSFPLHTKVSELV